MDDKIFHLFNVNVNDFMKMHFRSIIQPEFRKHTLQVQARGNGVSIDTLSSFPE